MSDNSVMTTISNLQEDSNYLANLGYQLYRSEMLIGEKKDDKKIGIIVAAKGQKEYGAAEEIINRGIRDNDRFQKIATEVSKSNHSLIYVWETAEDKYDLTKVRWNDERGSVAVKYNHIKKTQDNPGE